MSMSDIIVDPTPDSGAEQGTLARLAALGAQVDRLRQAPEWVAWLRAAAKFHHYSFGNQLLISVQRPDATRVAGYRTWQELGRHVRKGEKAVKILAPISRTREVDGEDVNVLVAFKVVSVFDVAQTEGDPLPEHPDWPFAGGEPDVVLDDVIQQVTAQGFDVRLATIEGATRGWCLPAARRIEVDEGLDEPAALAVLLHELGHCFDPDVSTDHSRADKELVAESTAYIVGTGLGLAMDAQVTAYLASWDGSEVDLLRVGRRVVAAVKAIHGLLSVPVAVAA
jgi:antirestriction protein ArdC